MSRDALTDEIRPHAQWYEDQIPIRGCQLNLASVKAAYRELVILTRSEGNRIVSSLLKPEDTSDDDFQKNNSFLLKDAFKVTVSIIGFDGQTVYGDTDEIFDSDDLPSPIKTIFFTNANSFKKHANGQDPSNRFYFWLHFDKPPLFDPNPLVSQPTLNSSNVSIFAEELGYYRAAQNIVKTKITSKKKWGYFIHEKFAYDLGLWFIYLPYCLYWITIYSNYFFPSEGKYASFIVAAYIYGLGISLILYRSLFGYVRWAFPVNTLEENKDRATRHRIIFGAIVLSLLASGVKSVLGLVV